MDLLLTRLQLDSDVTIGELQIDGEFECWTCEDTVREPGVKIHGQTAIPYGRYEVVISMSQRFGIYLPLLMNVPMFDGIRIHPGNTSADTDGCILPGAQRLGKSVGQSRTAFGKLFPKIRDAASRKEPVWIRIVKGNSPLLRFHMLLRLNLQ